MHKAKHAVAVSETLSQAQIRLAAMRQRKLTEATSESHSQALRSLTPCSKTRKQRMRVYKQGGARKVEQGASEPCTEPSTETSKPCTDPRTKKVGDMHRARNRKPTSSAYRQAQKFRGPCTQLNTEWSCAIPRARHSKIWT